MTNLRALILALDYGGTKHTAAVLAAGEPEWLAYRRVYSPPGADGDYDRATMVKTARELLARTQGKLAAIGVSFGGPVDATTGTVRLSHHVPGWEDTPLRNQLQAEFGVPAAVDNDANVAALGEWRFGAGQGCASLLYVTVSTGIGGGWVLGGRIWGGADGMAGEIGHVTVRPGGMPCACGRRGCVEAEACGPAIAAKARSRLEAEPGRGPILLELAGGSLEAITCELVAQAASAGDAPAREALEDGARALGAGLTAAIHLVNPERIVLGGGVVKSGAAWWKTVREAAREGALPQARAEIVPAALGDEAPLWGAAVLAEGC